MLQQHNQAVYASDQIIILGHSILCFLFLLYGSSVTLYMFFPSSCNKQRGVGGAKAKLALVFAGQVREFKHISLSKNDYCLIDVLLRNNNYRCITVLLL